MFEWVSDKQRRETQRVVDNMVKEHGAPPANPILELDAPTRELAELVCQFFSKTLPSPRVAAKQLRDIADAMEKGVPIFEEYIGGSLERD